ncbi:MAG: alpha/beta hydrolase [Chloroflexi bacterium]|nr:alpha/beta hydrolase [Chloroflexota bacterium]
MLDRPEILQVVFFPRQDWTPPPADAHDYMVDVEPGTRVSCRFYPASDGGQCILYFHGNGEVACDHDSIAPLYNRLGISLFVADYRGYGRSDGTPTFTTMSADAHPIFEFFLETVRSSSDRLFVMGRSLGSHSALELASQQSEHFSGLIVESGASGAARMASRFGVSPERVEKLADALSARIRAIELPALIIHGELDSLIPVSVGIELHQEIGSEDKRLVIIPGAEHNDIMMVGTDQYFSAIEDFVVPNQG